MQRRNFIKTLSCFACATAFASGCSNLAFFDSGDLPEDFLKNIKNDKFYYKSKAELPKKIRLEICSLCQLNCPACTMRMLEKTAPKDWLGYLKFKDFKNFVDDNDFEVIEISNNGEIFLNPDLDKIIEYSYKKGIKLTAYNGVNLNRVSDKTLENLVKYKFDKITVSIDGATPETYKIYRRGGDLNKVIDNIKKINHYKEKYNSQFPELEWQFIVFGHNEHEMELAAKKAKSLKMSIKYRKNYCPGYSPIKNLKKSEELAQVDLKNIGIVRSCKTIVNAPQIDYNGRLLGCHRAKMSHFKANVFKQGLLNALNSPDFIYAKHMLSDKRFLPKGGIPCSACLKYKLARKSDMLSEDNFI